MPRTSPFWDRSKVKDAVEGADSAAEALRRLGYEPKPSNSLRLKEACARYSLRYPAKGARKPVASRQPGRLADRDALEAALASSETARGVLVALGLSTAGKNYDRLVEACHAFSLTPPERLSRRPSTAGERRFPDRETFLAAVAGATSKASVIETLGRDPRNDYAWLKAAADYHRVELPDGRRNHATRARKPRRRPLEELLVEHSTYTSSGQTLKRLLIEEGLLVDVCSICGCGALWQGMPLTLQLDHTNGIHDDNRIENLRVLCPNCHSQTATFTGRNTQKSRLAESPALDPSTVGA